MTLRTQCLLKNLQNLLLSVMWFSLGFQNFIAKKSSNNNICDVFVSDFIRIWHKKLSNNELISISQELNPLLEASVQKLRDVILNSLEDVKSRKEINVENNNIMLKLESNILGMKFRFQVSLNQGCSEMFFSELTFPLLLLLKNIQNRENKLMKIIEHKDEEIAEYRRECGDLKSRFIATRPFIKEEFNSQESDVDFWDLPVFIDCIRHLSTEKLCKTKQVSPAFEEKEAKCPKVNQSDTKQSVSKLKCLSKKIGGGGGVNLDNQILKKRKANALKLHF